MTNNIFNYSPKELTTDAFLTWLIYYIEDQSLPDKRLLFEELFSIPDSKEIKNIKIQRQLKVKNSRSDVIVEYEKKGKQEKLLFENKTNTTTSVTQLDNYKKHFPDCHSYFYLKLAYINIKETNLCNSYGYKTISSVELYEVLEKFKTEHVFIDYYLAFLEENYVNLIRQLESTFIPDNEFSYLNKAQGQQYFLSELYKKLKKISGINLNFKTGSNPDGRPWTEIDICSCNNAYETHNETIFWRVDKRTGKNYIRLNQWSKLPQRLVPDKMKRLGKLRIISNETLKELPNLKSGKVHNRGKDESEIVVFFISDKDNSLQNLMDLLPTYTESFIKKYYSL